MSKNTVITTVKTKIFFVSDRLAFFSKTNEEEMLGSFELEALGEAFCESLAKGDNVVITFEKEVENDN